MSTAVVEIEKQVLTNRQIEILKLLCNGLTHKDIARKLKLSVKTVDAHIANIRTKIRVNNLAGLIRYGLKKGLIALD